MKVIAISGWKRSGKDVSASYLIEKYQASRVSFADPLKDMVAKEYNIPRHYMDDPEFKETPLLQYPIDPQDNFSTMLTDFMIMEFRDKDGKKYNPEYPGNILYFTPRSLCILKGSVNRSVDSSYWVKKACDSIKEKSQLSCGLGSNLHVIADLRYRSEMKQLKDAFKEDIVFIRVNRFDECPSTDPSEVDLNDAEFDFYIDNTKDFSYLFKQLDEVMNSL